jgi:hypothetical protein
MEFRTAAPLLRKKTVSIAQFFGTSLQRPGYYVCPNCRRQLRGFTNAARQQYGRPDKKAQIVWQPRAKYLPEDKSEEYRRYPTVTSDMLRSRRERPRRVKMLMRDFIEGLALGKASGVTPRS